MATDPKTLPAATIARLPVRYSWDTRYFNDRHEGIPVDGYGSFILRMLDHPRIRLHLNTDWHDLPRPPSTPVVYTGPLDRYFEHRAGHLGWRTLDLSLETHQVPDYQGCAMLNYADQNDPRTRTHEFRHYHPNRKAGTATVVMHERSRRAHRTDEPFYPINATTDREALATYRRMALIEADTHFGGRLGTYQYLDMHMAVASAHTDWTNHIQPDLNTRQARSDSQ